MFSTLWAIPYYLAIALGFLAFLGFGVSLFQITQEKARKPEHAPALVEWNPVNAVFFTSILTEYGLRVRRRIAMFGLSMMAAFGLAFCYLVVLKILGM
jgi:hypothetical protein